MTKNIKLIILFTPLLLFFLFFGFVVHDLKHPKESSDQCFIVETGSAARQYRRLDNNLYIQSDDPQYNIALDCNRHGVLFLNDLQRNINAVQKGQKVNLNVLSYQYLPNRWHINVMTGNDDT